MTAAKAIAGFVLGALLAVVIPPLALAMALVLGGILVWARVRDEDIGALTPVAGGFLLAVAAYVVVAVVAAVA